MSYESEAVGLMERLANSLDQADTALPTATIAAMAAAQVAQAQVYATLAQAEAIKNQTRVLAKIADDVDSIERTLRRGR